MVQIDNSQTIRISIGDDVSFPLFVNVGSKLSPIRYEFKVGAEDLVYFYILYPNDYWEDALETLEFDCTEDNINENGDIIITIPSDISERLGEGKFEYIIRGYIKVDDEYQNVTITNPHELWIVRDTDNDDEEVDNANKYFVYGELNYYIKNHCVEYSGENTDTAETIVNNNSKTIKVNVLNTPNSYVTSFNGDAGDIIYTAPVSSVNGNIGEVVIPTPLEPLIGNTHDIRPSQVLQALQEGRNIWITQPTIDFGNISTNCFNYSESHDAIVSNTIALDGNQYILIVLMGIDIHGASLDSDLWVVQTKVLQ